VRIFRVRAFIVAAVVLLGAGRLAAAQDAPQHSAHGSPAPARVSARPAPILVPDGLSPPQEAYASFPEQAAAAAAPAPPSACQLRLTKLAGFEPLPVLVGPGECGATDAVLLQAVVLPDQTRVAVTPPATLRCPMAEQVAQWVRDDVLPISKKFGVLRGLDNFDSYECRGRNRVKGATLSEHGRADALDVRAVKFADGQALTLTDINVDKDWRDGMRTSACARFSTVLGPGSDGAHEEHIHLDLAERHNNYKLCEWDVRVPVVEAKAKPEEKAAPASTDDKAAPNEAAAPNDEAAAPDESAAPLPPDTVPLPRPRPRHLARAPAEGAPPPHQAGSN
jgi:hypothetical protein